ncbi:MAG TPA: hypothetical protein VGB53_02825 [Rubricoccaceae bacterium]|jgi:DNA-binding transcriptional regulator GbsR (MarR family)
MPLDPTDADHPPAAENAALAAVAPAHSVTGGLDGEDSGDAADSADDSRHQRALDEFVRLWGEMATQWGINRTMAQIHALLYASERPLDTDEIMERLDISRGNANMNLRALIDWNLARKHNLAGSRKDYFVGETDVWTITTTIIEERQRREIKPVQEALGSVASGLRAGGYPTPEEAALAQRIEALADLTDLLDGFTTTLLPFLKGRNAEKVAEIMRFATRLRSNGTRGNGRTAP